MTKERQSRFRSKVAWVAVIAQIALIVTIYNPEIADLIKIIATAVVEILTIFGILNDPTNKTGF